MKILSEVVKTFDVETFQVGEGDAFRFRLEVSRKLNTGSYVGKVYRLEMYRLQPTLPQTDGSLPDWKNDALIHVADDMFDSDELRGESVQEVVEIFEKSLKDFFSADR